MKTPRNWHWVAWLMGGLIVCVWAFLPPGAFRTGGPLPSPKAYSLNNLKNIGLAARGYSADETHLPSGAVLSPDGTPLYGWPVELLPYLDSAAIYREIDKEVPWNHPSNRKPMEIQLPFYLSRGFDPATKQTSEGYGAIHYAANSRLLFPGSDWTVEEITDGEANTLIFGEAAGDFQAWGSPNNSRETALGLNRSPSGFGSPWSGLVHFAFADGRATSLSDNIDPKVLEALSTPQGGEPVDPNDY